MAYKIGRLINTDYRAMLRRFFNRSEVEELISAGERIAWPKLNKRVFRRVPPKTLKKHSAALGIDLVLGKLEQSKDVLGFYLPKMSRSRKPLIWLDATVKHGATLGATFIHETGHHVAGEVLGHRPRLNSLDHASSRDRLDNRNEIAADVFVSLAGMPRRTAIAMFGPDKGSEHLRRAFRKMCERNGFSPAAPAEDEEDLALLVGALHYMKLREALLTEFGV